MIEDIFTPVKVSLADLNTHVEQFIESYKDKRAETRGTYERSLREFTAFFATDKRFRFLVKDVERYKKHLMHTKHFKEASVATYMTALRRLCQYLVDSGVLEKNPAKRVHGGRRPTSHNRTFLTIEQVDLLLESIDTESMQGLRDRAIIRTMLGCACSEVEITHINIGDLRQEHGHWMLMVQGKGKEIKDEKILVPNETEKAIRQYLEKRGDELESSEPMFVSMSNRSRNRRVTVRGLRQAILDRFKQSGIRSHDGKKLTPFCLRHTAGILLAESGATPEELMQRMRIEWKPTAMLYFEQRGKLRSQHHKDSKKYISADTSSMEV
jgi:site-specific recombinase XerD